LSFIIWTVAVSFFGRTGVSVGVVTWRFWDHRIGHGGSDTESLRRSWPPQTWF